MRNSIYACIVLILAASSGFAKEGDGNCNRGGCSGQMCVESTSEPMMSTCEFQPEYVCTQKFAVCERQPDGECGFTLKPEYKACMNSPEDYLEQQ